MTDLIKAADELANRVEEHAEELVGMIEKHARWLDGIRSAVETNQVTDKDVRGMAILMRDESRAILARIKGKSNE